MDPTSVNSDTKEDAGIWFNIKKFGSGKDTEYKVDFNKKSLKDEDGDTVYKNDRSAIPDSEEFEELYAAQGYDLSKIYRQKTYDQLKEILLYNIALVAKEVPEAANIPGFEVGDNVEPLNTTVIDDDEEPTSKPLKKVALALGDDDEEEETPIAKLKSTKKPSHEDTMALADSILGD